MTTRITQLDTIRGVATLGILIMNSVSLGLGDKAYFRISAPGTDSVFDWIFGVFGEIFADQKCMGMFSLLFGASLLLFLDRVQDRTTRPVGLSLWRNTLLILLGLVHSLFWVGDVLMVYGICAPILLLFRNARAKTLMWSGLVVFSSSILCLLILANSESLSGELADWESETTLLYISLDVFARAFGMMLIGMSLYRSEWLTRPLSTAHLRLSLWAVGIGGTVSALGVWWVASQDFSARAVTVGNLPNLVIVIPMSLGYTGLIKWWDEREKENRLIQRIRAVGRMALSNYLSQTAICLCLASVVPASYISRSTIWGATLLIWALQVWSSEAWLRRFKMGPVERFWRVMTYRKWT